MGKDRSLSMATIAAIVCISALAFLLANIAFLQLNDQGQSIRPLINSVGQLVMAALIAVFACLAVLVLLRFLGGMGGRESGKTSSHSNIWGLIFALAIIALLLLFVQGNGLNFTQGQGNQTGNNTTAPPPSPSNGGGLTPDATIWLITFVAVISVMVVVSMRFLRTGRVSVGLRRENLSQRATSIVNEALSELRTTDDARGAVIRAYWQMNRLFGKRDEEAFLTPKEFAHLLVAEYGWPSKAVDDLTKVFEEARYSEHAIGEEMKELAVGSLQQIRDALLGRGSGSLAS
ncbi:MAG TPA: DUF4129 domain-containing protein [Methanomassiliicoccales archaeon]|nr:DUF4129 domain-containing protein [Methanomassiliicoccales archaeon]